MARKSKARREPGFAAIGALRIYSFTRIADKFESIRKFFEVQDANSIFLHIYGENRGLHDTAGVNFALKIFP